MPITDVYDYSENIGGTSAAPSMGYIIKVASRCNLNCPYCYMYNLGDDTYLSKPKIMAVRIFEQSIDAIKAYMEVNKLPFVAIYLHGGEPLLAGKGRFESYLRAIRERLGCDTVAKVHVQTNGVLIDAAWIDLFNRYDVGVGVSLDGPEEIHDIYRITHAGKGTHNRTEAGIALLKLRLNRDVSSLCVINPEHDPISIYDYIVSQGIKTCDFILPDFHHSMPPPFKSELLSGYLIKLYDHWYGKNDPDLQIRFFVSVMTAMIGGGSTIDAIGAHPISDVVVETDGNLQPLDVLRTCENGFTLTSLHVGRNSIEDLRRTPLFQVGLNNQRLLPTKCHECSAYHICGGGYLPHRYERGTGFRNPSVHCDALLATITHIHATLTADLSVSSPDRRGAGAARKQQSKAEPQHDGASKTLLPDKQPRKTVERLPNRA